MRKSTLLSTSTCQMKQINTFTEWEIGRAGTKGLAISFISSQEDTDILNEVQSRFEVKVEDLPTTIDKSTYMNN